MIGKKKVRNSLNKFFGPASQARDPLVTAGPIASSDLLVKDTATLSAWKERARHIQAVEMELRGVYTASRRKNREYPVLAVRGISDVVGLNRSPEWTEYACHSAAAFAKALIATRPIEPVSNSGLRSDQVSSPDYAAGVAQARGDSNQSSGTTIDATPDPGATAHERLATAVREPNLARAKGLLRALASIPGHSDTDTVLVASAALAILAEVEDQVSSRLELRRRAVAMSKKEWRRLKDPRLLSAWSDRVVDHFYDEFAREEPSRRDKELRDAGASIDESLKAVTDARDIEELLLRRPRCSAAAPLLNRVVTGVENSLGRDFVVPASRSSTRTVANEPCLRSVKLSGVLRGGKAITSDS